MQISGNRNRWHFPFGNSSRQDGPGPHPAGAVGTQTGNSLVATLLVVFRLYRQTRTDTNQHTKPALEYCNNSENTKRVTSSLPLFCVFAHSGAFYRYLRQLFATSYVQDPICFARIASYNY